MRSVIATRAARSGASSRSGTATSTTTSRSAATAIPAASSTSFFHELGFDILGQLELSMYLQEPRDWPVRERIAGRDFRA